MINNGYFLINKKTLLPFNAHIVSLNIRVSLSFHAKTAKTNIIFVVDYAIICNYELTNANKLSKA